MSITQRANIVFANESDQILITKVDGDRYFQHVSEVVAAEKFISAFRKIEQDFAHLEDYLTQWIEERKSHVSYAHLTGVNTSLAFIVVPKFNWCDEAFQDELSDLDVEIAHVFPDLRVNVMGAPSKESIGCFTQVE